MSYLAQTSGSHLAGQGQTAPRVRENLHPITAGWDKLSFPERSFQQGPSELVFREQGFWGIQVRLHLRVASAVCRTPHQPVSDAGTWYRQKQ